MSVNPTHQSLNRAFHTSDLDLARGSALTVPPSWGASAWLQGLGLAKFRVLELGSEFGVEEL